MTLMAGSLCACGKKEDPATNTPVSSGDLQENVPASVTPDEAKLPLEKMVDTIQICTAEDNKDHAWMVSWPDLVITENYRNTHNKLVNPVLPENLTMEEKDYLINYIRSLEEQDYMAKTPYFITKEDYAGHQYLGSVVLNYTDDDGTKKRVTRYIFDEYPEGYSDFIAKIGQLCGADYITLNYNVQEITTDYFRRWALVSDDIEDAVLEEYLEIASPDMFQLLEQNYYTSAESALESFSYFKHLPRELLSVDSTDDECSAFALELAKKFGGDAGIIYLDESDIYLDGSDIYLMKDGGCIVSAGKYGDLNVYPSTGYPYPELISTFVWWENTGIVFYNIQDPSGPEGMLIVNEFVYSEDGKFMILLPGCNSQDNNDLVKIIFNE